MATELRAGDALPAGDSHLLRGQGYKERLQRQEYYGQGPVILMREADTVCMRF
ncbi:hypothetical protein ABEH94_22705 [Pantoea agglomerans]|uniref:hypothetical protein n=1 Tax=Enterobacter agglomerans TaxID=549 RepID=UPI003207E736